VAAQRLQARLERRRAAVQQLRGLRVQAGERRRGAIQRAQRSLQVEARRLGRLAVVRCLQKAHHDGENDQKADGDRDGASHGGQPRSTTFTGSLPDLLQWG
jgi:hypothetical protein